MVEGEVVRIYSEPDAQPPATSPTPSFGCCAVQWARAESTACAWEIWRRASQQAKAANGKRLSAFVVIRNSYRELKTRRSPLSWTGLARRASVPSTTLRWSIVIEYGDLDCLILFRSLDKPQDVRKLLSLELTGRGSTRRAETPRIIVNRLAERVGRYPPPAIVKPTWFGIWADTQPAGRGSLASRG